MSNNASQELRNHLKALRIENEAINDELVYLEQFLPASQMDSVRRLVEEILLEAFHVKEYRS